MYRSLETSGSDDYIKPWVWVLALFLGPVFVSICFQWYIYMGTRALARTQGIITELVFEHSLRIRFKAESSKVTSPDTVHDLPALSKSCARSVSVRPEAPLLGNVRDS